MDPARQFASPYLYVGNFVNPINGLDSDGNQYQDAVETKQRMRNAAERNQHMADVFMEFNGDNPEELYEECLEYDNRTNSERNCNPR